MRSLVQAATTDGIGRLASELKKQRRNATK